jgi:putative two-component system response regulator
LFKILEKTTPDLILLDIEMPEMSGYEVIKKLREMPKVRDIPVIFLTAKNDDGSELEGLSLGAIDYISKPFSPPLLVKRIENHLKLEIQKKQLQEFNDSLQEIVRAKTKNIVDLQQVLIRSMADLVEQRDENTGGHVERTQNYVRILLEACIEQNVYKEEIDALQDKEYFLQSTLLHDVGKIHIQDRILLKPARLDEAEFEVMKDHARYGEKIIQDSINEMARRGSQSTFLEHAKIFAGTHHEKWDGSGYPRQLSGLNIPLHGRVMAIADVYDALITQRPYKKPFSHEEAAQIIIEGRGKHFDPKLVDVFVSVQDRFQEITKMGDDYMPDAVWETLASDA